MVKIPNNIEELKSYKPGKPIGEIIKEFDLEEVAVLWNNENNFGPSPMAMDALKASMHTSHLYPDPACLELRDLIADKNGIKRENVAIGNGSESIFNNLFNAFFEGNDSLLTCEGTFVAVHIWAKANNVEVQTVPLTSTYNFDLQALIDNISENTKAIYLSNPNNPTGAIFTHDELARFMEQVPNHILVILDEAYYEFARDLSPDYPDSTQFRFDNMLTLRTFSKAYGIAAIRIGYALANARLIEALMKVKLTFEPSNVAQAAGIGAIQDVDYLNKTVNNNTHELHFYYRELHRMGFNYVPSYANFVMLDMATADAANELFEGLMKKGVFVRTLKAFGLPHCVRITVGLPNENRLCIKALEELRSEVSV